MRITCPNCTAGFEIPTQLLGRKGRSLKCATCGHSWFQAAVVDEIDLADVLAETKKDASKDMGGAAKKTDAAAAGPTAQAAAKPGGGSRTPDTAAVAAAANAALEQGATGGPGSAPPGKATSIASGDDGRHGGPQAAALAGKSMRDQAGATATGEEAISWMEKQPEYQDQAGAMPIDRPPGTTGGPGAAPQSADAGYAGEQGAVGGPGAAPQAQEPGYAAPGKSLKGEEAPAGPAEKPISWLDRDPSVAATGIPGMPGMPGALPAAMPGASAIAGGLGAMGGAPGAAPGAMGGAAAPPPVPGQSMMGRDPMSGPGAGAVSQLTGQQVQAPGQGARSMLSGETVGGPGGPAQSQMGGDVDAPGGVAVSMLDGSEHAGGAQGGAPEEGANGGPGQSMLGEDEEGGASGGPGQTPAGLEENDSNDDSFDDDDSFHQAERGAGDDDELDRDDLADDEDDDAFHQAERGEGEEGDEEDEDDEDELVDPDDDRPDFGGSAASDDEDDLEDDVLAEDEDGEQSERDKPKKKKPTKKSKPLDPAYVTAVVMTVVVGLIGSVLFAARDQLSDLWPGINGVYEALGLDDDSAEGLRLSSPVPVRIMKGGVQTLVVSGFVTNLSPNIQPVPNVKLMLIDKDNNVVQETSAAPSSPTIDPNSTQPYRIELQLPVESATSLKVDWD
ncbi:MAG: DUF3426 domain-containing protein [Rhodospirillaceae bacterium]